MKHLFILFPLFFNPLFAEVLVITHSYNRPDFIEIQYRTFKKFLKDDYRFVVFNDAPGDDTCNEINNMCNKLGLECIRIPQKIHTYAYLYRMPREEFNHPCVRCANVVQYSLNEMGLKHDDVVAIIDSDMFLVKEFSIRNFMKNIDLAGLPQERPTGVNYIWNGLVFFDMKTLPNKELVDFNCGQVNHIPVDVGGQMHHYLKKANAKVRYFQQDYVAKNAHKSDEELASMGFEKPMITFIHANPSAVELYEYGTFIHYRSGTNWDGKPAQYHHSKTEILNQLVADLLS